MQLYQRVLQQMDYDVHLSSYAETSSFLRNSHGNSTTSDHGGGSGESQRSKVSCTCLCKEGGRGLMVPQQVKKKAPFIYCFLINHRRSSCCSGGGAPHPHPIPTPPCQPSHPLLPPLAPASCCACETLC